MEDVLLPPVTNRVGDVPAKKGALYAVVEIDCAHSHNVMLPNGVLVPNGVHKCRVPEVHIDLIETMVEPEPEMARAAQRTFEAKLQKAIAEAQQGKPKHQHSDIELEIRETFTDSMPACFRKATGDIRDLQPFASVKVVQRGLLADADEESTQAEEVMAKRVAAAIGMNGAAGLSPEKLAELVRSEVAKAMQQKK